MQISELTAERTERTERCEAYSAVRECAENLSRYIGRGKKMFHGDAQDYIRELRDCDRN